MRYKITIKTISKNVYLFHSEDVEIYNKALESIQEGLLFGATYANDTCKICLNPNNIESVFLEEVYGDERD